MPARKSPQKSTASSRKIKTAAKKTAAKKTAAKKTDAKKTATKKAPKKTARKATPARPPPSTKPLWQRLGVKAGHTLVPVAAPAGYSDVVGTLPSGAALATAVPTELTDKHVVHVFVRNSHDMGARVVTLLGRVPEDALVWVSYPKGGGGISTDVTRDHGWSAVYGAGWMGVAQIAVDDTWSAIRLRPTHKIGK